MTGLHKDLAHEYSLAYLEKFTIQNPLFGETINYRNCRNFLIMWKPETLQKVRENALRIYRLCSRGRILSLGKEESP